MSWCVPLYVWSYCCGSFGGTSWMQLSNVSRIHARAMRALGTMFAFCLICNRGWLRVLGHPESQRFTHTTQGSTTDNTRQLAWQHYHSMKLHEPQPGSQSVMQAHNSQQSYIVSSAVLPEMHCCLIGYV